MQQQPCPVCANFIWKTIYKIKSWDVLECKQCDFARIYPFPEMTNRKEYYSKAKVIERNIQKSFGKRFLGYPKFFLKKLNHRDKHKIFSNKFFRYLSPGAKVLDIGCGDGSFLETLKHTFHCTGIEISEYLGNLAKNRGNIDVFIGNLLTSSFPLKQVDGITLISLIEHVADPARIFQKCYELLNPNGVFLLKTVNYNCLNRKIMREKWNGFRPPDHMIYFSPGNLKQTLQKVGFQKIKISAFPFNDNMYCDARK